MSDRIDSALRPLVARLRARYPSVTVVEARRTEWDDGFVQQIVRYRATLAELKRCGLVTEEMLTRRNAVSACGETSLGDGFHLSRCAGDARGEWELALYGLNLTDEVYFNGKLPLIGLGLGREQGNVAAPREYGVTVTRHF